MNPNIPKKRHNMNPMKKGKKLNSFFASCGCSPWIAWGSSIVLYEGTSGVKGWGGTEFWKLYIGTCNGGACWYPRGDWVAKSW